MEENSRVAKSTEPDLDLFLNAVSRKNHDFLRNRLMTIMMIMMMIMMMMITIMMAIMMKRFPATRKATRLRSN